MAEERLFCFQETAVVPHPPKRNTHEKSNQSLWSKKIYKNSRLSVRFPHHDKTRIQVFNPSLLGCFFERWIATLGCHSWMVGCPHGSHSIREVQRSPFICHERKGYTSRPPPVFYFISSFLSVLSNVQLFTTKLRLLAHSSPTPAPPMTRTQIGMQINFVCISGVLTPFGPSCDCRPRGTSRRPAPHTLCRPVGPCVARSL